MSHRDFHNTGKVKIGLQHNNPQPRLGRDFSHYELTIQRGLLPAPLPTLGPRTVWGAVWQYIWRWL